ncbi:MAG: hypothetical protein RL095_1219 [Verrucomicrobiota bacterium]|jgi:hypothetical protein
MNDPIAIYSYQRFDSQAEFRLYSDRLETVASDILGNRHEAQFLLVDLYPEPESSRHWNPWHRRGLLCAFFGTLICAESRQFPLAWQGLVFWGALGVALAGAACFFANSRYEHWRMFRMTDGRVLWICLDRKNPEAGELFVKHLNEAILTAQKTLQGEQPDCSQESTS